VMRRHSRKLMLRWSYPPLFIKYLRRLLRCTVVT
jgi:hypothetical protein